MSFILAIFSSKLARQVGAALLLIIGIFAVVAKWFRDREEAKDAKDALETHERINDADTGEGNSDADLDWLRKRGKS